MVERLWSYWPIGLWVPGIMVIVYLVFRKADLRRVFVISLLGFAVTFALSWWAYAAQSDLPVRTESTALGTRTTDVNTSLSALFGLLFSFYGFMGTAAIWAVHEVVRRVARRRTSRSARKHEDRGEKSTGPTRSSRN
ncbi:hypothetical protein BJG92_00905 [Arthrobacter sp. SO5]|nr:hypothetical protein [Arthrobacter sp. SO5]